MEATMYPTAEIGVIRHTLLDLSCRMFAQQLRMKHPEACASLTVARLGRIERGELCGTEAERAAIAEELGLSVADLWRDQ